MTQSNEWTQKGATLTEITAQKEYGIDRDFIIRGIKAGAIEFRNSSKPHSE